MNGFGLFRFGFLRKSFLLPRRQPGLAGPNRLPRFAGLNAGRFSQPLTSKPAETWAGRGGCPAPVQRDPPRRGERPRQPLAGWSLSCPRRGSSALPALWPGQAAAAAGLVLQVAAALGMPVCARGERDRRVSDVAVPGKAAALRALQPARASLHPAGHYPPRC